MSVNPFCFNTIRFLCLAALSAAVLPACHAQSDDLSGRYQCAAAKVQGRSIPCNAAPLTLRNDGRFELRGWEGSYNVNGQWVELSDNVVRSRARIEPGHKIVFRYQGKHGWCEMIYERRIAELGKTSLG
jgi:hypothetical protein